MRTHCFISCSPTNRTHEPLALEQVLPFLEEGRSLAVREYYFTGGEPFLNPDMEAILEATLEVGPATVLTNGLRVTAVPQEWQSVVVGCVILVAVYVDMLRRKGT